uniref:Uncharacterized protein n=1 Tax=Candidatus Kentrum sp. DK TaxID=2126562 RepID=A0A450S7Z2_9GAMM|nr:MAG: hypothetical protein BECKDK2373B_GA0170837_101943 [Candidatus Kentron sp. DK]
MPASNRNQITAIQQVIERSGDPFQDRHRGGPETHAIRVDVEISVSTFLSGLNVIVDIVARSLSDLG